MKKQYKNIKRFNICVLTKLSKSYIIKLSKKKGVWQMEKKVKVIDVNNFMWDGFRENCANQKKAIFDNGDELSIIKELMFTNQNVALCISGSKGNYYASAYAFNFKDDGYHEFIKYLDPEELFINQIELCLIEWDE